MSARKLRMFSSFACWFLVTILPDVHSMQSTNLTCNLTAIRDMCRLDLQKNDRDALYETMRIAQCFKNTQQYEGGGGASNLTDGEVSDRIENFKCLFRSMKLGEQNVNKTGNGDNILDIFRNFEFGQTYEELGECGCVVCLVAKFHDILVNRSNDTRCNETNECSDSGFERIGEHLRSELTYVRDVMIRANVTGYLRNRWVKSFLDFNSSDRQLNTQTIKLPHLPVALRSKEDTYFGIPVKQVGGTSGIVILSSMYVTGLVLNCILIRIFIRHEEMRKDSKLIIVNVAVADMLNLVLHSPPIDVFLVNSIHSPLSVTYVFYMIIGLNIYSVMIFSCHIYLTVLPLNNRRTSGCKMLKRYSPHVHALTASLLACIAPIPLISVIEEYYTVSLYVLVTYCAVPLCVSTLFSVGTSLHLGLCVQSIHCGSTGHESVRTSRARSANTLVALIVVSAVSYVPYCCLPFIPPYIGEQPDDHPFLIPWVFVWFNSFINPIALYVANRDFRRFFNKYLCFCCCSARE